MRLPLRTLAAGMLSAGIAAAPAAAAPPSLALPMDCRIGETCWIARYMAHGAGDAAADYRCGRQTESGHRGTDIAIRDRKAMRDGVRVLAAAAGTVTRMRDGMADRAVTPADFPAIEKRACGNAAAIDHGDGWSTLYCHMRRGSVLVRSGDRVAAGQPIGLVGLSGKTDYPHLHLSVLHRGRHVDPFVGPEPGAPCRAGPKALWRADVRAALAYRPFTVINTGLSAVRPDRFTARAGSYRGVTLPGGSPTLFAWVEAMWLRPGDRLRFRIYSPDGLKVHESTIAVANPPLRAFFYSGRRRGAAPWPAGRYGGEATISRRIGERLYSRTVRSAGSVR